MVAHQPAKRNLWVADQRPSPVTQPGHPARSHPRACRHGGAGL